MRLSLCLSLLAASTSGAASETVERRLAAMGTRLEVRVEASDRAAALAASEQAVREISRVEALLSTWKAGGPLERLNQAPPGEPLAIGEAARVLARVWAWAARSDGAFNPTVLPLARAWGLRGQRRLPSLAEQRRALEATGLRHFTIDIETGEATRLSKEAGIDEGAWGKGYALDLAADVLKKSGVRHAVLDLGGQVLALGSTPVAIAHPRHRDLAAASLRLSDASLSTSGNSERGRVVAGRRIGHLLDPRTGRPAPDFGSATAIAPSGLEADILSTAFFVLGPQKGLALSEKLRRDGYVNEALFLVVRGDRLEAIASPGMSFRLEEVER